METLRSKAVFEATMFSKVFGTQPQEELNCVRERTNTEDLYAVAVIRRSAIVGHVPPKISAACALFLRRNHLRLILFNTQVQSCHEKFGRVWVVRIMLTSCLLLARI